MCALRRRHLDLTRRVLVIRTSIARSGSETYEKDTKLHQRRHIALDPRTAAMLAAYQRTRRHRAAQYRLWLSHRILYNRCHGS